MPPIRPSSSHSLLTAVPLLAALALSACAADVPIEPALEAEADQPVERAYWELPSYATRALSNPYVSVYRYTLASGDTLSLQEGSAWVLYSLNGAALDDQGDDQFVLAPDAARLVLQPTVLTSIGSDTAEVVVFERTENPLPDRITEANPGRFLPDEALDLDQVGGDAVRVLVAEQGVLVSHVTLKPGDTLPLQSGFSRVIYALSDYTVQRFGTQGFGGSGSDATLSRKAGDAAWNTASNFAAENVGSETVEALVIAYYR